MSVERRVSIVLGGIFGTIASTVVYLAIGALAHHLLVAPYFDPYRMMSWGVLLGWPMIFLYCAVLFIMFIGGAIMAIAGLYEKEWHVAGFGAVLWVAAWFGWRLFF
ncbi:MAG: hypothetical protein EOP83_05905 [Verrucomicrobiaceae bacterium]|nr:MAG: hypothetical protein EOP83_05905 [Verrucomicrobiaceae bacterium]